MGAGRDEDLKSIPTAASSPAEQRCGRQPGAQHVRQRMRQVSLHARLQATGLITASRPAVCLRTCNTHRACLRPAPLLPACPDPTTPGGAAVLECDARPPSAPQAAGLIARYTATGASWPPTRANGAAALKPGSALWAGRRRVGGQSLKKTC